MTNERIITAIVRDERGEIMSEHSFTVDSNGSVRTIWQIVNGVLNDNNGYIVEVSKTEQYIG